jgi:phage terminase large subunit
VKLDINAEFPEKLDFLFEPHRYKVLWGGRGAAKSWGIARALEVLAAQKPLRILCGREIQKSLADSVHSLLKDQVAALGLADFYEVQETRIIGRNGTEFIFAGLKTNIASLKSLEAIDICWVEEAQTVSKASWDILIPTVRKEGSEIWVSFNPLLETDDTYRRFVLNTPPGAMVRKISWRDNPWFPDVLRIEKDHLQATDPQAYEHVWEGAPNSAITGAIFAEEIKAAEAAGRICKVSIDRTRPVHTFWDLGFGDATAIWFAQALPDGGFRIIDYLENRGQTIEWYVIQMQAKQYMYGVDWLPHDGVDAIVHARLGGDTTRSIEQLMRAAGRKVRISPKLHVTSGINAARTIFPQCWFDAEKCADGLQALRHYQYGPATAGGVEARKPLHNFASHGADAFRTLAVSIKAPPAEKQPVAHAEEEYSWMA